MVARGPLPVLAVGAEGRAHHHATEPLHRLLPVSDAERDTVPNLWVDHDGAVESSAFDREQLIDRRLRDPFACRLASKIVHTRALHQ